MRNVAYDTVIRDLLGVTKLDGNGGLPPSATLSPDADGPLTDLAWSGYVAAADAVARQVMMSPTSKAKFLACDVATDGCLTSTIKTFGRKAFRRPLRDDEVTSFLRLDNLTPKGTPDEVAEAVLRAFLSSPSFILLPELGADKEGAAIRLTSYEVATRLSFLLWDSIPDETLNTEADAGRLTTAAQIAGQAKRMLASEKATAIARSFHRAYLGMSASHWFSTSHDPTRFPAFSPAAASALEAEIYAFLAEVTLKGGSFEDLFLSNVAFVTKDTAPIYGLDPASFGAQATRIELDPSKRPGFLTRAGFLSSFSEANNSSPMRRGAFVSSKLLGINVGPADPSGPNPQSPSGPYTSQRQLVEVTTSGGACKACHVPYINPPGFVLEQYDAIGSWQDTDPLGGPIDSTATVRFSASDTSSKTITSPLALMTELARAPQAQHVYAEQLVSYATGRTPNPDDACVVDELAAHLADPNYRLVDLMADYTQAASFRLRSLGN